jgi:hypothetical protein
MEEEMGKRNWFLAALAVVLSFISTQGFAYTYSEAKILGHSLDVGNVRDVVRDGNYAYALSNTGLQVLDLTNKNDIKVVGNLPEMLSWGYGLYGGNLAVAKYQDVVYSVGNQNGLLLHNVADPFNPRLVFEPAPTDTALKLIPFGPAKFEYQPGKFTTSTSYLGMDIAVKDKYAFVVVKSGYNVGYYNSYTSPYQGLHIFDLTDPTNPKEIALVAMPEAMNDFWQMRSVIVKDNIVYASTGTKIYIIDISSPANPRMISSLVNFSASWINSLALYQNYLYVSCGDLWGGNTYIFNVGDPYNPFHVKTLGKSIDGSTAMFDLSIQDNFLYTSSNANIYNLQPDPLNPKRVKTYSFGARNRLQVKGDMAFITDYHPGGTHIDILDITNPMQSSWLRKLSSAGNNFTMRLFGNRLFYGCDGSGTQIRAYDISNPLRVVLINTNTAVPGPFPRFDVKDNFLYAGSGNRNAHYFTVYDYTDPANPKKIAELKQDFGTFGNVSDVRVLGDYAYCTVMNWSTKDPYSGSTFLGYNCLKIIDISVPAKPLIVSSLVLKGPPARLEVIQRDNHTYCAISGKTLDFFAGITIVDVTDAAHPEVIGAARFSANSHPSIVCDVEDITVQGNYAYCANYAKLEKVDLTDLRNPRPMATKSIGTRSIGSHGDLLFCSQDKNLCILRATDMAVLKSIPTLSFPTNEGETGIQYDRRGYLYGASSLFSVDIYTPGNLVKDLEILPIANQEVTAGEPLDLVVYANAIQPDAQITLSAQGVGFSLDAVNIYFRDQGNGTAVLSWTPQVGQQGTYKVQFTATSGNLTDTKETTIEVK